MDARTEELRAAHDVLAPVYADVLADHLDGMPAERALLDLYAELVRSTGVTDVVDVGCGTGRLLGPLASRGLRPYGVDLSPEMVRTARRDNPDLEVALADVRALPFADGALGGAVAWYSLMYLPPDERPGAYAEMARVVSPGGYVVVAFKLGDDTARRGGVALGVELDIWWMSRTEVESRLSDAGFTTVLWSERPADPDEAQPQGYLVARRG